MLARSKEEILAGYTQSQYGADINELEYLKLEVLIDIRDRLETLCAVQRKILTVDEKRLGASGSRNSEIKNLAKVLETIPIITDDDEGDLGLGRGGENTP